MLGFDLDEFKKLMREVLKELRIIRKLLEEQAGVAIVSVDKDFWQED